jgi:hypothetical protein
MPPLSTGVSPDYSVETSNIIEIDHERACEMTWHPAHEPCEERADYKILIFDATCGVWHVRVTCTPCAGSAWISTVESRYCECSSEHAWHELGRFRMESIR